MTSVVIEFLSLLLISFSLSEMHADLFLIQEKLINVCM